MSRALLWKLARGAGLALLALAALVLGMLAGRHHAPQRAPTALAAFLDVGDGDCTLVRTVDGRTILLDAGPAAAGAAVVRDLQRLHVTAIDLLVLASPDARSIGGVPAVLAEFPVRAAWGTGASGGGEAWRLAREAIARRRVPLQTKYAGDHIQIGAGTFWAAVWPPAQGPRAHRDHVAYQFDYGTTRVLLAGALRPEGEEFLTAGRGASLGCGAGGGGCSDLVLQASAGGAEGSLSAELLHLAAPAVVVASCGTAPAPGVLHRVQVSGAALWRTDTQGTVLVTMDGRTAPAVTAARM